MELADIQKRLRDAIKQSGIEQKEIAKKSWSIPSNNFKIYVQRCFSGSRYNGKIV